MPVPLVPLVPLALGAGLALWTLYEKQHAKEAHGGGAQAPVSQVLQPVALAPGAAAFLPPVVAPEPIRNLMANALASNNPAALRATAQNLQGLGYGDLAGPLIARATAIESGPVVAAGWFEPETVACNNRGAGHGRNYPPMTQNTLSESASSALRRVTLVLDERH